MTEQETLQWLLENGGPAIRYRTATELLVIPATRISNSSRRTYSPAR